MFDGNLDGLFDNSVVAVDSVGLITQHKPRCRASLSQFLYRLRTADQLLHLSIAINACTSRKLSGPKELNKLSLKQIHLSTASVS